MTDVSSSAESVPARLGVTARLEHDRLALDLRPEPATLHHGIVRASVLSFVIDAVSGIEVDGDVNLWTLTSDLSVRMRPIPAPDLITGVSSILRRGARSVACTVELTARSGEPVATGAAGFVLVPRKESDPPKPVVALERLVELFGRNGGLSTALRVEAGVEVVDAAQGVVQVAVTSALRNPNGTLQGAMVALVAEAAVEDLVEARFGVPAVVTDLDIRYLARAEVGPVRTVSRLLGEGPDSAIEVKVIDTSTDTITTLVYARVATLDGASLARRR
jgi:acyl-coenzyme A thioesterase PaaI-like protein